MTFTASIIFYAVCLFLGILLFMEIGWRVGLHHLKCSSGKLYEGLGAIDGAVFGLLGLLIAFTFSGAASRFDDRGDLIVEEANAISTAYQRLDLVPAAQQPLLREKFRQYTDSRLQFFKSLPNLEAARVCLNRADSLYHEIWKQSVGLGKRMSDTAIKLLLPALNSMGDIAATRSMALRVHPPLIIFVMLGILILICSGLAGYGLSQNKKRCWVHFIGFAMVMTATFYVILDLEYPRAGLVRVDAADQVLIDVRESMR